MRYRTTDVVYAAFREENRAILRAAVIVGQVRKFGRPPGVSGVLEGLVGDGDPVTFLVKIVKSEPGFVYIALLQHAQENLLLGSRIDNRQVTWSRAKHIKRSSPPDGLLSPFVCARRALERERERDKRREATSTELF